MDELETLRGIVRDLALSDVLSEGVWCQFCKADIPRKEPHEKECPYRRAVEAVPPPAGHEPRSWSYDAGYDTDDTGASD